jgi:hypothetical protein
MEQIKKFLPQTSRMSSRSYFALPAKAYTYFVTKISGRWENTVFASFQNGEEDAVVGYESSWAGVYKTNNTQ